MESIKVHIAGREYPLTVPAAEADAIREAAVLIEKRMADFRAKYKVVDKQDLLAMAALHLASEIGGKQVLGERASELISQIGDALSEASVVGTEH